MAFTTFDPTTAVGASLSNGNLTVTSTGVSLGGVKTPDTDSHLVGKYYFENTVNVIGSGAWLGVCKPGIGYPSSATAGALVVSSGGSIWVNGSNTGLSIGTPTAGSVICFAIDLDNLRAFARLGATGNWNGNASITPATPSTGVNLAGFLNTVTPALPYASVQGFSPAGQVTANFGATAFTGAVPTGYTSGWTSPGDPVEAVVTATGAEVWASGTPSMQVTTAGAEVWGAPTNAPVFLSQLNAEAWLTGNPAVNLSSQQLEVWFSLIPAAVLSAAHMEVWFDQKSLPSSSRPNFVVVT